MKTHIVYQWLDTKEEPYFVSKCTKGSEAPFKDKTNILAPSDPERIVILKEFDDEMESLDYLDRLTYELGFIEDGGQLQNKMISPYHLRTGRGTAQPVSVYRRKDQSFIGDYESVTIACKELGINQTSGYASLNDVHYAGNGKYRFLPQGEPYRPIPKTARKSRPRGNVHPSAKACWAYTKTGEFVKEFGSYGQASLELDIDRNLIYKMIKGDLYSSGNYCVRDIGQSWNPPKHSTRPVKEVYGFDPSGTLHEFPRLVDASTEVSG